MSQQTAARATVRVFAAPGSRIATGALVRPAQVAARDGTVPFAGPPDRHPGPGRVAHDLATPVSVTVPLVSAKPRGQ